MISRIVAPNFREGESEIWLLPRTEDLPELAAAAAAAAAKMEGEAASILSRSVSIFQPVTICILQEKRDSVRDQLYPMGKMRMETRPRPCIVE